MLERSGLTPPTWFADATSAWIPLILADAWKTTPFVALLLLAGLQSIDRSLYEAAEVDGAGPWQRFTDVTLPLLKPALLVALLFRALDAFRVFDVVYVMTGGGPGTATEPIALYTFSTLLQNLRFGYGSALSVIVFAVAFVRRARSDPPARAATRSWSDRDEASSTPRVALVTRRHAWRAIVFPLVLGGRRVAHAGEPALRTRRRFCRARSCSTTTARSSATATSGRRSATRSSSPARRRSLSVALGALCAYALARLPFRGKSLMLAFVLAVSMFPQIAIVSPLYLLLRALGLLNTYPGLVLPYLTFAMPLTIWLLVGFFRQLPRGARRSGVHGRRRPAARAGARSFCRCRGPGWRRPRS